jgi:hypothetical protein
MFGGNILKLDRRTSRSQKSPRPTARRCRTVWLGVVGVHLAKLELAERKKDEEERRHLYEALEGLR